MEEVINILNELKNNSGNNLIEILNNNSKNELLKKVLYFVYNPFITTGLSNKKIKKQVSLDLNSSDNIEDIFSYLESNSTGKDCDIAYVQNFINKQPKEYKEIYEQIFTKELKLGITSKTINKVWKNLIPEFDIMLAEKYMDRIDELERNKPQIIITQKLDGIRCVGIVNNNNVKLYSRQGKLIIGLLDIEGEMKKLENGCYDGELLLNQDNLSSKDLYRETVTIVNSKNINKQNIIFNVFDYFTIEDFINKSNKVPCYLRKNKINSIINGFKWITPVPILYEGNFDNNIVQKELNKQISLEHEGIMVNISNATYENKRTKNILKVKAMQDCDLKIIGFEEGTGKNKGTLGSLIVDYKGNKVGVGSGLTQEDRDKIWNNQKDYLNKICEIQYFEETQNKKDNSLSLRFPVFLRMRFDKTEPSYY